MTSMLAMVMSPTRSALASAVTVRAPSAATARSASIVSTASASALPMMPSAKATNELPSPMTNGDPGDAPPMVMLPV